MRCPVPGPPGYERCESCSAERVRGADERWRDNAERDNAVTITIPGVAIVYDCARDADER